MEKKDLRQKYPSEFKRKLAKAYESGQYSYGALAAEYGLKNHTVVREFVKWHRRQPDLLMEHLEIDLAEMKQNDSQVSTQVSTELSAEQLRAELEQTRRQLSHAELKVEALETMIDLAEQAFSIAIRKKSGTRQSKK